MSDIASYIDHTLLRPETHLGEFTQAYRDASFYNFKSICVSSAMVPLMSSIMFSHPKNEIVLCETVGFPHGTPMIDAKLVEINQGIRCGVTEFDVVPLLNVVKSGDWDHFGKEISQLREASKGFILKIILETGLLTTQEIIDSSLICIASGVDFLKTSTGFNVKLEPVKTAEHVTLLKTLTIGTNVRVKASGGIRTLSDVNLMLAAGADRVGSSYSVNIMEEFYKKDGR